MYKRICGYSESGTEINGRCLSHFVLYLDSVVMPLRQ